MLAAYYDRIGPADEVLRIAELPTPIAGPGEVRVRVRWSGVNPSDVKSRLGSRGPVPAGTLVIPHSDGMGEIESVGAGVDASRIGERVWIWNAAWGRPHGTAAQYVVLPHEQAVTMPAGVPDEAGACFGIPALTALHSLLTDGGVAGQRVLVAGGAGAVGHYAIQFARLLGAREVLTTVSSAEKSELALQAGATATINYRTENTVQRIQELTDGAGIDRIIEVDIAANATLNQAVMRAGGHWVIYGSGAREFSMPFFPMIAKAALLRFFIVYSLTPEERETAHAQLAGFLNRGALQHHIGARVPLAQIAQAHQWVEQGAVTGNVVLSL